MPEVCQFSGLLDQRKSATNRFPPKFCELIRGFVSAKGQISSLKIRCRFWVLARNTGAINVEALEGRVTAEDPACAEKYLERYAQIARTVTDDPGATVAEGVAALAALVKACGVPGLGAFGLTEGDFDDVVAKSKESSSMKGNPVALSDEELKDMLRRAL